MQVEHAVADGYDVRGLLYWTLLDNFEVSQHCDAVVPALWWSRKRAVHTQAVTSLMRRVPCIVGVWMGAAFWSFRVGAHITESGTNTVPSTDARECTTTADT